VHLPQLYNLVLFTRLSDVVWNSDTLSLSACGRFLFLRHGEFECGSCRDIGSLRVYTCCGMVKLEARDAGGGWKEMKVLGDQLEEIVGGVGTIEE